MDNLNFNSLKEFLTDLSYNQIFKIIALILAGMLIIRVIRILLTKTVFKHSNRQNRMLMLKLVNYTGFVIILIIVLSELGISLTALLGAAGVLGIALGVASQKSLGNIISGFFMVTEKSFEIGDAITVGDKTGIVHSVELLSIKLKTFDNLLIRIPNETLITTDVVNITRFPIRRMDLVLSVAYSSDLDRIIEILKKVASDNIYCLDEPGPFIMIKSFENSGIELKFGIWFDKNQYVETRNSVMKHILEEFRNADVEIPYPHLTISNASSFK